MTMCYRHKLYEVQLFHFLLTCTVLRSTLFTNITTLCSCIVIQFKNFAFPYTTTLLFSKYVYSRINPPASFILFIIVICTSNSHFSTIPFASAGRILLEKGTVSFSELTMPIISISSVNLSLAIPSKHFFRCGCTRSGSFVSERISSSSSLDRKKNLEYSN